MKRGLRMDLPAQGARPLRRLRAVSPLSAWHVFLRLSPRWGLLLLALGLISAAGVWGWHAVRRVYLENPEYQWRYVALNRNPVLDVPMVMSLVRHVNQGEQPLPLFELNLQKLREVLLAQPGVVAARVERQLPQTLKVVLDTREPCAWLECAHDGISGRPASARDLGYLMDQQGVVFQCPERMWESARDLPVVVLTAEDQVLAHVGKTLNSRTYDRCMALYRRSLEHMKSGGPTLDRLTQENEWSITAWVRDGVNGAGVKAVFGLSDQDRQFQDLKRAQSHALKSGKRMQTINLIPSRYVPVTYANDVDAADERIGVGSGTRE